MTTQSPQNPIGRFLPRQRGFSIVELILVMAILVILGGIFVPYFAKIREADRRVRCADNLRVIMTGLQQYAMLPEAPGKAAYAYPSTPRKVEGDKVVYAAYSGADATDPFAKGSAVKPNDVTASLWLLARTNLVPPSRFICPSTSDVADPLTTAGKAVLANARSNFTSSRNLSYSYASPFSAQAKYRTNEDSHVGDFALMADKNPGVTDSKALPPYNAGPFQVAAANSRNHGRVGQNVLYADGHVSWQPTPYCGFGSEDRRDNIYTALATFDGAMKEHLPVESPGVWRRDIGPTWADDSYLLPTSDE